MFGAAVPGRLLYDDTAVLQYRTALPSTTARYEGFNTAYSRAASQEIEPTSISSHQVVLVERLRVDVILGADVAHELHVVVVFRQEVCLRRRGNRILRPRIDVDGRGHILRARQRAQEVSTVVVQGQ